MYYLCSLYKLPLYTILILVSILIYLIYKNIQLRTKYKSTDTQCKNNYKIITALKCQDIVPLAILNLEKEYEKLTILWYSDSLYEWLITYVNNDIPSDITNLNWYDIFPTAEEWKQIHVNCVRNKITVSNDSQYWNNKDLYLKWTCSYLYDNNLLFCFIDTSEYNKTLEELVSKTNELNTINQTLINFNYTSNEED